MATNSCIVMNWINLTNTPMTFFQPRPQTHGTNPTATPGFMDAGPSGNTSSVQADPSDLVFGPGPEGIYQWLIGETMQLIQVIYNHPFGTGKTTVTITCPDGYLVAACGEGPATSLNLGATCVSLQSQIATVQIQITQSS